MGREPFLELWPPKVLFTHKCFELSTDSYRWERILLARIFHKPKQMIRCDCFLSSKFDRLISRVFFIVISLIFLLGKDFISLLTRKLHFLFLCSLFCGFQMESATHHGRNFCCRRQMFSWILSHYWSLWNPPSHELYCNLPRHSILRIKGR